MRLFFGFKEGVKREARSRVLKLLRSRGPRRVERLFPRSPLRGMSSRYYAEAPTREAAYSLVTLLNSLPEIDYAQAEVRRRPLEREHPP